MDPLTNLLTLEIYRGFLVLVRVAAAIGFLPGFGENAVPVRIRAALALIVALVLLPGVEGLPDRMPEEPAEMLRVFAGESLVGAWLGIGAKLFMAALQTTGALAAQAIGLSNPFSLDAAGFEGGSVLSGVLLIGGLALMFASDVHYLMIGALARSYGSWPVGEFPEIGPLVGRFAQLLATTFQLAVGLAAPFLLYGLVFNVALGLVNRVMPAMPVYFIGTPILLVAGLGLFLMTVGAMLTGFVAALGGWLSGS
ncbi:flagellar biosynthetic protein FliR [Azospirillum doebereinerae]|uniref:flagellar biosynthetic protein FliR n=1 Tax=Azospirillum doebereinerae TaxID=92933 RepID=UPI001EE524B2|nr:flagellar biosynthetic protein FliR [Azospirillum doebereinerae]MCG5240525.1 flagellar biosynthetic protein FliR [Azospirillum doebereinerae]